MTTQMTVQDYMKQSSKLTPAQQLAKFIAIRSYMEQCAEEAILPNHVTPRLLGQSQDASRD